MDKEYKASVPGTDLFEVMDKNNLLQETAERATGVKAIPQYGREQHGKGFRARA